MEFVSVSDVVDYYIDRMEERGMRPAVKDFTDELTDIKLAFENGENKLKIKARVVKLVSAFTK